MSNSSLVVYKKLSPNCNKPRNQKITHIVVHHMAGNGTIEALGNLFANPSRQASSNYGIGSDGRIGMYVEEANRSWCSSSGAIDHKAITIEVANDGGAPNWHVSDKAFESLVALCTDICKRNGIKELKYTGDKSGNLHMHKWYASTGCPGPYLGSKFPELAKRVNANLKKTTSTTTKPSTSTTAKPATSAKKDVETLAQEVIQGKWGAGNERRIRLVRAGYDYNKVQARVNEIMAGSKPKETKTSDAAFLKVNSSRGWFQLGDKNENIGKLCKFMYDTFPDYAKTLKRNKENLLGNYYGENIQAWIKEFQKRNGLEADGCTGPLTLAALKKAGFKF